MIFLRLIHADTMPLVSLPNPERVRRELGPNQLRWLRRVVPHFRACERDATKALRHAVRLSAKVRGLPQ